jgi:hypothetical protein
VSVNFSLLLSEFNQTWSMSKQIFSRIFQYLALPQLLHADRDGRHVFATFHSELAINSQRKKSLNVRTSVNNMCLHCKGYDSAAISAMKCRVLPHLVLLARLTKHISW